MEQNKQIKESKEVSRSRYRSRDSPVYTFRHTIKAQTGSCCVCIRVCVSMFLCVCLGMSVGLCMCTYEWIKKVKLILRAI